MVWQSAWLPVVKLCHDIDIALYDIPQLFPLQVEESESLTIFLANCIVPLITLVTLLCAFFNFTMSFLRCRDPSHTPCSGYRLTTPYVVVKCSMLSCSCYPDWWCQACCFPSLWWEVAELEPESCQWSLQDLFSQLQLLIPNFTSCGHR